MEVATCSHPLAGASARPSDRGRIEKILGAWKRSYRLRWMRWKGLAKATTQISLTAIAYNFKRNYTILRVQGA